MKTTRYMISRQEQGGWIWCADGDTSNGCFADLPEAVLTFADTGKTGLVEQGGETYRVDNVEEE